MLGYFWSNFSWRLAIALKLSWPSQFGPRDMSMEELFFIYVRAIFGPCWGNMLSRCTSRLSRALISSRLNEIWQCLHKIIYKDGSNNSSYISIKQPWGVLFPHWAPCETWAMKAFVKYSNCFYRKTKELPKFG